jgi:hypothetical protein
MKESAVSMEFCFEHDGKTVCVPIPVLREPWWWPEGGLAIDWDDNGARPNPWVAGPKPWVIDQRIDAKALSDLSVLASIARLTNRLSRELRQTFEGGIEGAIRQLQLPADVHVTLM